VDSGQAWRVSVTAGSCSYELLYTQLYVRAQSWCDLSRLKTAPTGMLCLIMLYDPFHA